ncbi:hypothetical protein NKH98_31825 [Mesorhizobium sp. M0833]|uniref:hypothetical protein n=1 Tax=Mesorhizobium sp. M0833 TaxID=2957009 RepID=UPI00333C3137
MISQEAGKRHCKRRGDEDCELVAVMAVDKDADMMNGRLREMSNREGCVGKVDSSYTIEKPADTGPFKRQAYTRVREIEDGQIDYAFQAQRGVRPDQCPVGRNSPNYGPPAADR